MYKQTTLCAALLNGSRTASTWMRPDDKKKINNKEEYNLFDENKLTNLLNEKLINTERRIARFVWTLVN